MAPAKILTASSGPHRGIRGGRPRTGQEHFTGAPEARPRSEWDSGRRKLAFGLSGAFMRRAS